MTSPVNVQFNENKIAEAIMLLCKISVNRELLTVYTPEQVVDAATQVIKQSTHAFIIILDFLAEINEKYDVKAKFTFTFNTNTKKTSYCLYIYSINSSDNFENQSLDDILSLIEPLLSLIKAKKTLKQT